MPSERRRSLRKAFTGPGGARARLLDPDVLERAQAGVDALAPQAKAELEQAVAAIMAEAQPAGSIEAIAALAHDVASVAGSFGLSGLGVVAGEIRAYAMNRPAEHEPDWSMLLLLAQMLRRALDHPEEASDETLATQARALVSWGVARQGAG